MLIYAMGDEPENFLQSFNITEDSRKKYSAVKKKFEEHFIMKHNVVFECASFNIRIQTEGGSVDSFITDLYTLAKFCNVRDLRDELIPDRIVVGIRDKALSGRLSIGNRLDSENKR